MKAEELIKALKCCTTADEDCKKCPYCGKGCFSALHKDTLRYIQLLKQDKATVQAQAKMAQAAQRSRGQGSRQ